MSRAPGRRVVLSCGEASGDLHASSLVDHLLHIAPGVHIEALGGAHCERAGARVVHDYRRYAMLGFSGILPRLVDLYRLERDMKRRIRGADLFIAVDYPGMNLRLAHWARRCHVPVLYYIAPQVWAWGAGRARKMARFVDRLAVILPFEEEIFRNAGVATEYVGHPFAAEDSPQSRDFRPQPETAAGGEAPAASEHGETTGAEARTQRSSAVALLPGSRRGEVDRVLPVMLGAARVLQGNRPDLRFELGCSPAVAPGVYRRHLAATELSVTICHDTADLIKRAGFALVASGTATLQTALAGTPMVIVYRVSTLNFVMARALIRIDTIGLVNVVLGRAVAPELIQRDASVERIAAEVGRLMDDEEEIARMKVEFSRLRGLLSGGRGSARVAEIAAELMS